MSNPASPKHDFAELKLEDVSKLSDGDLLLASVFRGDGRTKLSKAIRKEIRSREELYSWLKNLLV